MATRTRGTVVDITFDSTFDINLNLTGDPFDRNIFVVKEEEIFSKLNPVETILLLITNLVGSAYAIQTGLSNFLLINEPPTKDVQNSASG
jgi:hypothetical protein